MLNLCRQLRETRDCRSVELRALCNEVPRTPPGPEGSNGIGNASGAAVHPKFLASFSRVASFAVASFCSCEFCSCEFCSHEFLELRVFVIAGFVCKFFGVGFAIIFYELS